MVKLFFLFSLAFLLTMTAANTGVVQAAQQPARQYEVVNEDDGRLMWGSEWRVSGVSRKVWAAYRHYSLAHKVALKSGLTWQSSWVQAGPGEWAYVEDTLPTGQAWHPVISTN